jgi:hypothetical protein
LYLGACRLRGLANYLAPGGIVTKAIEPVSAPVSSPRTKKLGEPKAIYHIHVIVVASLAPSWPEQGERERCAVALDEALDLAGWREEIAAARDDIRRKALELVTSCRGQ